ncbi:hypothetical protein OB920_13180 [Halobacteria archaeon HArc-gm2]|nr:hypothetical protein [Halobacteria archaeon HArc-gm2]
MKNATTFETREFVIAIASIAVVGPLALKVTGDVNLAGWIILAVGVAAMFLTD